MTLSALARDLCCLNIIGHVAGAFGVTEAGILCLTRGTSDEAFARQIVMYLMHCSYSYHRSCIGRALKRDPSCITYALPLIEGRRDDVEFDRKLTDIEDRLNEVVL